MEKFTNVEFDKNVNPKDAIEVVRSRGACAVRNFATAEQLEDAAELLRSQRMVLDENMTDRVKRRQHMNAYGFGDNATPPPLQKLAVGVKDFVHRGEFDWQPNEIIAHRYESSGFIGRHRDYSEAYGLVAVLTIEGHQDFYVELDGEDDPTQITMEPGMLTVLRGFTGNLEDRPFHWVTEPEPQRTAISIRDMRSVWTPGPNEWA